MRPFYTLVLILTNFSGLQVSGQADKAGPPLFNSDELIEITLHTDFEQLLTEEEEEEEFDFDEEDQFEESTTVSLTEVQVDNYIPGLIQYQVKYGEVREMDIKLRARGHFRRTYCDFPPLKFQFLPELIKGTPFENQYKLKLVTHCERDIEKFNDAVIHEYLIYKSYSIISDLSLDVRLVKLNYQRTDYDGPKMSSFAFFIQSIDELAAEIDATEIEDPTYFADPPDITPDHRLAFFQYMIGNNDWEIPGHNCKMLSYNNKPDTVAIPYDFDLSYLSYAHSFPLPKKEYKGGCPTQKELNETVAHFNRCRPAIIDLYNDCEWIDSSSKQESLNYIEKFYRTINNPVALQEEILKGCEY